MVDKSEAHHSLQGGTGFPLVLTPSCCALTTLQRSASHLGVQVRCHTNSPNLQKLKEVQKPSVDGVAKICNSTMQLKQGL